MKMSKEKWVAFPDVTEKTDGVITMGWTGLPSGFDQESLQLNVRALERGVIGWGGYAALTLAAYNGDQDQYTYGVGSDSAGNGYATGVAVAQKAETSQRQAASDQKLNAANIRNSHLGVSWNITTLNQRLDTVRQFDPKTRAKQLDREISTQTLKAVWGHNVVDYWRDRGLPLVVIDSAVEAVHKRMLLDSIANYHENSPYGAVIVGASILGVVASMQGLRVFDQCTFNMKKSSRMMGIQVDFKDCIRDPFFYATRPTRALAASAVLSSSKLVRPTPTKQ